MEVQDALPALLVIRSLIWALTAKQSVAILSGIGGWSGIGIAAGIGPEDPTAGLGALGAFADVDQHSNLGGVLTVFSLP